MTKVCIFNKSNDVSRFNIFKKFFECVNSKISLTYQTNTWKQEKIKEMWGHD